MKSIAIGGTMITDDEPLVPLSQAGKHVPRNIPRPHPSTCIRWALRGIGTPRVKLETIRAGGRRFTSAAAIRRFFAALSGTLPSAVADSARRRATACAKAELDAEGI